MGGGCSTKRSIIVNDADSKINMKKIEQESKDGSMNQPEGLKIDKKKLNQKDEKKLGKLMKKQLNPDDFEESVEDLNDFGKQNCIKSEKEYALRTITYQDIWNAIYVNDTDKLEKLLKGKDWTTSALFDKDKNHTMLHTASALGHVESLMTIIEHTDAKPDLLNSNLATPLHFACRNNHDMVAKFLIGWGVDVNVQDEHGQTCLLICCIHGHKKLAQILVESSIAGHTPEPLDVDLKDNRGLTPLNCTAIKGDLHFLKYLIEKGGAKIDEPSPKGCTALLYAARGGHIDMVKYLLEKGANALHQDNSGGTVAHHAIEKGKAEIMEILVEYSVDIDVADNAGRTPLYEAIDNNLITITRLLVTNGARVDITDYSGHTPCYCAARDGNEEILKILVDIGKAKVDHYGKCSNPKDIDEDMEYENEDEKLIMEGLDESKTPLHVSSLLGYKEIVEFLIENCRANPNITGDHGYNSLHLSIIGKQPEVTQYLLTNSNADYSAKIKDGKDVRDLVEELMPMYLPHYDKLIESLASKRLETNMESETGVVATHYYTPEDDRELTGVQNQEEVNKIYQEAKAENEQKDERNKKLTEMKEEEINIEQGKEADLIIDRVFGNNVALGLISTSWKLREEALKYILKQTPNKLESDLDFIDAIKACSTACNIGIQDKVMKVFNAAMAIFSFLVSSSKLEESGLELFVRMVTEHEIISKLLQKCEEGNARISNKAQEGVIDFSFHPMIGEGFATTYILSRLESHLSSSNPKGTLWMLNLLSKFISSFGITKQDSPLSPKKLLKVIIPPLFNKDSDLRTTSLKLLLEIHKKTGWIDASIFKDPCIPSGAQNIVDHILKKISEVEVEQRQELTLGDDEEEKDGQNIDELKDKGRSKDWGQREIALNKIREELKSNDDAVSNEGFAKTWVELLGSWLEENNISIYLVAVDVVGLFFKRWLMKNYEILIASIDTLVQPLSLHTNDTNTRVRKKSTEVILELWDNSFKNINQKYTSYMQDSDTSVSAKIASVLMDSKLGEKSIVGRINVYSKRLQDLTVTDSENANQMLGKPHQVLLGANYTTITEFAIQWCLHKNTKVRQLALRLIVDLWKFNQKDPNGGPFKQKIVNYILGLKPSLRNPLIKKINQVCKTVYINAEELGIDIAVQNKRMSRSKSKDRNGDLSAFKRSTSMPRSNLPEINSNLAENNPIVVLPYYEPMKDDVTFKYRNLINIFNEDIIGCFVSQSWSNRQAALDKIIEQLPNLDENTKDPMKWEINKFGLPIDEWFTGFCQLLMDGIKDPVLKIYLSVLDVMQQGLPLFFRKVPKSVFQASLAIKEEQADNSLYNIIKEILKKTSDLKLKLRVASKNICIYLAHQSTIGPEHMANITIESLQGMIDANRKSSKSKSKSEDATSSLCNSTMWSSCLSLLTEYQRQAKLASTSEDAFTGIFMKIVNSSLQHHTPAVRKEAENLFIELYKKLGTILEKMLVGQKQAVVEKLIASAKKESGIIVRSESQKEEEKKASSNYISSKIKSDFLPESIQRMFGEEVIEMLKAANPKKRQKALVEIKKIVSKFTVNLTEKKAKDLSEPITHLMRQILSDESSEVYLEALKIVKFIIASFAPHLGTLDLHILIGSFIGIIVSNTVSSNVRIQVASDKVVIFFAKHNNIGPFVVARDIIKNIEKISHAVEMSGSKKKEVFSEKKSFLTRFLSILLLLVNQFSIVLWYEADFNDRMIACLAQLVDISDSDQNIRSLVSQILAALHSIDQQTLSVSINKLDPVKKAPLLKIKIEMEAMMKNGKGVITESKNTFVNSDMSSHTPPFRMSPGGRDSSSRTSLYSPGNAGQLGIVRQNTYDQSDGFRSSDGFKTELRASRRLMNKQGSGMEYSTNNPRMVGIRQSNTIEQSLTEKKPSMGNIRRSQINKGAISKFTLPDVAPKGNNVLPPIAGTSPGFGMGSYQPSAMSSNVPAGRRGVGKSQRDYPFSDSINRPPLYKKASETVREGSKFSDDPFGPSGRYRQSYNTQSDFKTINNEMNSSTGMMSNVNTILTGTTIPQATFELSTTKYGDSKPKKSDSLDKELGKFSMR